MLHTSHPYLWHAGGGFTVFFNGSCNPTQKLEKAFNRDSQLPTLCLLQPLPRLNRNEQQLAEESFCSLHWWSCFSNVLPLSDFRATCFEYLHCTNFQFPEKAFENTAIYTQCYTQFVPKSVRGDRPGV
jgi:hypothetical protein